MLLGFICRHLGNLNYARLHTYALDNVERHATSASLPVVCAATFRMQRDERGVEVDKRGNFREYPTNDGRREGGTALTTGLPCCLSTMQRSLEGSRRRFPLYAYGQCTSYIVDLRPASQTYVHWPASAKVSFLASPRLALYERGSWKMRAGGSRGGGGGSSNAAQ